MFKDMKKMVILPTGLFSIVNGSKILDAPRGSIGEAYSRLLFTAIKGDAQTGNCFSKVTIDEFMCKIRSPKDLIRSKDISLFSHLTNRS